MQDEMSKSDAMNHLMCWQGWPTPANVFQENNFSSTAQKYLVFMQAPGWLEIVHRWRMRNDKSFCIDIISWLLVRWRWYVCANYRQEPGIPIMINIIYMPIADVSSHYSERPTGKLCINSFSLSLETFTFFIVCTRVRKLFWCCKFWEGEVSRKINMSPLHDNQQTGTVRIFKHV